MAGFQQTGQQVGFTDTAGSPIVDKSLANSITAFKDILTLKDQAASAKLDNTTGSILQAVQAAKDKFERQNAIKPVVNVSVALAIAKERIAGSFPNNVTEVGLTFDKIFKVNQSKSAFSEQNKKRAKKEEIVNAATTTLVNSNDGTLPSSFILKVTGSGDINKIRATQLEIDRLKAQKTKSSASAARSTKSSQNHIFNSTINLINTTADDIRLAFIDAKQSGDETKAKAILEQVLSLSSSVPILIGKQYANEVDLFAQENKNINIDSILDPTGRANAIKQGTEVYKGLLSFVTSKSIQKANKESLADLKTKTILSLAETLGTSKKETAKSIFLNVAAGFSVVGNKADVSGVLTALNADGGAVSTFKSPYKAFVNATKVSTPDDLTEINQARSFVELQQALADGNEVSDIMKAQEVPLEQGGNIVKTSVEAGVDAGKISKDNAQSIALVKNTIGNMVSNANAESMTREIGGSVFEKVDKTWLDNSISPAMQSRFVNSYGVALGNYFADSLSPSFEKGIEEARKVASFRNFSLDGNTTIKPLLPVNKLTMKIDNKGKLSIAAPNGFPDINKSPIINDLMIHITKIMDNYKTIVGDRVDANAIMARLITANTGIQVDNVEKPLVPNSPIPLTPDAEILTLLRDNPNLTFNEIKKLQKKNKK